MAAAGFDSANVGDSVSFSKTVGESDVYLFAGITGDLNTVHINEHAMKATRYGQRIAHGVLVVGFMSTTSSLMIEKLGGLAVSYGYDGIRFIKPVFIGDTVTIVYTISELQVDRQRTVATVHVTNQDGLLVAVAQHILHFAGIASPSDDQDSVKAWSR
jgi:3-hydroxybutyryl-CoA dehydratase